MVVYKHLLLLYSTDGDANAECAHINIEIVRLELARYVGLRDTAATAAAAVAASSRR